MVLKKLKISVIFDFVHLILQNKILVFIGSSSAIFWRTKVCTVMATVAYRNVPYEYYWFPTKEAKIEANREFFAENAGRGRILISFFWRKH